MRSNGEQDWTLVQYVFPSKDHPLTHQWLDDGSGHFMGLRLMLEATGDSCTSARFDDFCVCRTNYAQGSSPAAFINLLSLSVT